ncbi:hypothetical protein L218DRAFT_709110 [Marasmius fiardii PR-910]|nr:hypothetical protein L218DRAFT_709110 [Marasmius fiardii PR-910]
MSSHPLSSTSILTFTTTPMSEEVHKVWVEQSESRISGVSLYSSGLAEITRSCKLSLKKGQNHVEIPWLPWVMDTQSLRVEGRGPAIIQDVNLTENSVEKKESTPKLDDLTLKKTRVEKAQKRCKKAIGSLEAFLGTLNAQYTRTGDLPTVLSDYEAAAGQLDDKLLEIEQELKQIDEEIEKEKENLAGSFNVDLGRRASIGLVADADCDVELILIYAVTGATWKAGYDIRVDTSGKDKPVSFIYKAIVSQSTRESWENVPLTLETASPTFGLELPVISQWNISVHKPYLRPRGHPPRPMALLSAAPMVSHSAPGGGGDLDGSPSAPLRDMERAVSRVTSQGSISATFRIPGFVTIPSDGGERSFTIVELALNAAMTWFSIPKIDTRVHLKIQNESEYTFLPGQASVYVDGSFIAKSDIPSVSPFESFDCPLGLDPSIRITYHPVSKKTSTSGLYNKTTTHVYIQRLTVHNTKFAQIPLLKITDQVPVSENSEITVKLVNPALKVPSGSGLVVPKAAVDNQNGDTVPSKRLSILSGSTLKSAELPTASISIRTPKVIGPTVNVSGGVVAVWDGADDVDVDIEALGKDGKMNWLCELQGQEKVNLTLQWEVSSKVPVYGL